MTVSRLFRSSSDGNYLFHYCAGCESMHQIKIGGDRPWQFNGNLEKPTFSPSVKMTYDGPQPGELEDGRRIPYSCCHYFVNDGMIQYLGDCTHKLAGQTLPMQDLPEDYSEANYHIG